MATSPRIQNLLARKAAVAEIERERRARVWETAHTFFNVATEYFKPLFDSRLGYYSISISTMKDEQMIVTLWTAKEKNLPKLMEVVGFSTIRVNENNARWQEPLTFQTRIQRAAGGVEIELTYGA